MSPRKDFAAFHHAAIGTIGGGMENKTPVERFDKMSNLSKELQRIEKAYIHTKSAELAKTRNSVVGGLQKFGNSRFQLGRVLRQYKMHFKSEHGWVAAAKLIAAAMDRDVKTVFRMIEAYETASQLPAITLDAMREQNIDPAAAKHAGVVANLLRLPEPKTSEKASAVVREAFKKQVLQKAKRASVKADLEAFAERVVKQFEERYRSATPQQRDAEVQYILELLVNRLRAPIRELRQFGRPTLVPKPSKQGAA